MKIRARQRGPSYQGIKKQQYTLSRPIFNILQGWLAAKEPVLCCKYIEALFFEEKMLTLHLTVWLTWI